MTRPGIEPRSPGPLANTLPTRPKCKKISLYDFNFNDNYIWNPMTLSEEMQLNEIISYQDIV